MTHNYVYNARPKLPHALVNRKKSLGATPPFGVRKSEKWPHHLWEILYLHRLSLELGGILTCVVTLLNEKVIALPNFEFQF